MISISNHGNSNYFQINDISLLIPPTAISVHKENLEYSYKTLRTRVSTKVASGNGILHAQIGLVFAPDGLLELHRLVCQVKNNPFVCIKNDYLKQSIGSNKEFNYFTLIGLNISNHPSAPNSFIAELDIRYFNEKVYDEKLGFRKYMSVLKIDSKYFELPFNATSEGVVEDIFKIEVVGDAASVTPTGEILASYRVENPADSADYVAYSNYLQMKQLKANFGIDVKDIGAFFALDKDNKYDLSKMPVAFHLAQSKISYITKMLYGDKVEEDKVVGFLKNIDTETIVFGFRDFKKFDFPPEIMKDLRKLLAKGITRGMTVAQKEEKRKENAKEITEFLKNAQADKTVRTSSKKEYFIYTIEIKTFFKPRSSINSDFNPIKIQGFTDAENNFQGLEGTFYSDIANLPDNERIKAVKKGLLAINAITATGKVLNYEKTLEASSLKSTGDVYIDLKENSHFPYLNLKFTYDESTNKIEILEEDSFSFNESRGGVVAIKENEAEKARLLANAKKLIKKLKGEQKREFEKKNVKQVVGLEREKKVIAIDEDKVIQGMPQIASLVQEYLKYMEQNGYTPYTSRYGFENVLEGMIYHVFPLSNFIENMSNTVVTSISGGFKNLVASIPVLGQSFPTHQYMGGMEPMYQFNFIGKSESEGLPIAIKNLEESIQEVSLRNAKFFAGIPGGSNIFVQSLITRLLGSTVSFNPDISVNGIPISKTPQTNFSISSSDSFTIEGNPKAVGYNLRLSETKTYDDELLNKVKSNNINESAYQSIADILQESARYGSGLVKVQGLAGGNNKKTDWKYMAWESKLFKAEDWYKKRKRGIGENYKDQVTQEMDKNAYYLCVDYLDVISDFLKAAGEIYGLSNLSIELTSTLDLPSSGSSRKETSQHKMNAAADFQVVGMPTSFAVQLIEFYGHYALGSSFKYNRFENARSDAKSYGLGLYGKNTFTPEGKTIANYYQGWSSALLKDGKEVKAPARPDGFIHIDLNLEPDDNGGYKQKNSYRRWVGKELKDRFCIIGEIDISKYISDIVKEKSHLFNMLFLSNIESSDTVAYKLVEAEKTLNQAFPDLSKVPAGRKDAWDTAHETYARKVRDIFFPSYRGYKLIDNNTNVMSNDYSDGILKKETLVSYSVLIKDQLKALLAKGLIESSTDEESIEADDDATETKPAPEEEAITVYNLSKEREIRAYFKDKNEEALLDTVTIVPYSELPDNLKTNFTAYKDQPNARFALINLEESVQAGDGFITGFKSYVRDTFQVSVATGEDEDTFSANETAIAYPIAEIQASRNYDSVEIERLKKEYAGLFDGFQALASLILTEPALYLNDNEETAIKAERERITKELYGIHTVPSFYTTLRTLFIGSSNREISREKLIAGLAEAGLVATGAISTAGIIGAGVTLALGPIALLALAVGGAVFAGVAAYNALRGLSETEARFVQLYEEAIRTQIASHVTDIKGPAEDVELVAKLINYYDQAKNEKKSEYTHLDMYKQLLDKDTWGTGIDSFIKNIFAEIPVFKDFYDRGVALKGASSLATLLTTKKQTVEEGNVTYEAFTVFSNEIIVNEIMELIRYFTEYPMVPEVKTEGKLAYIGAAISGDKNDIEDFDDIVEPITGNATEIFDLKYNPNRYEYQKRGHWEISGVILKQVNSGINYFTQRKPKLKTQNDKKLAFLKVILESLLKDIAFLEADNIRKANPKLAAQVEELDLLDLVDKNLYPDIEVPKFYLTNNGYSETHLTPYYYYYGFANDKKFVDRALTGSEERAIKKTIDDSRKFMENLKKGIYTGTRPDIDTNITPSYSNMLIDNSVLDSKYGIAEVREEDLKLGKAAAKPLEIRAGQSEEELFKEIKSHADQIKGVQETLQNSPIRNLFGDKLQERPGIQEKVKELLGAFKNKEDAADIDAKISDLQSEAGLFAGQQDPLADIKSSYKDFFVKDEIGIGGAFPTFKLFIVEEDANYSDRLLVFDDFFSYNSVISFSFHNSRELPATTASIQLQNISGTLDGSKKEQLRDIDLDQSTKETIENEDKETIIDSVVLRPGVNVQLRAGYGSNTRDLDILLSGRITEINYTTDNTVCNITVQSYGVELDAVVKGNLSRKTVNDTYKSTHELLGNLLLSKELKHFGRVKKGRFFQIGESQDIAINYEDYNKTNAFTFGLTRSYLETITSNLGLITFGATVGVPAIAALVRVATGKFGFIASIFTGVGKAGGWIKTGYTSSRGIGKLGFGIGKLTMSAIGTIGSATGSVYTTARNALHKLALKAAPGSLKATAGFARGSDNIAAVANALKVPAESRSNIAKAIISRAGEALNRLSPRELGGLLGSGFFSRLLGIRPLAQGATITDDILAAAIRGHVGTAEYLALGLGRGFWNSAGVVLGGIWDGFVGSFMFRNILPVTLAALIPALGLAVVDAVTGAAVTAYNNFLKSFRDAKETLLAKILITPQDDNIFCPRFGTYTRTDDERTWTDRLWRGGVTLTNAVLRQGLTFGFDVLDTSVSDLEDLMKNPLRLLDKRMDITRGENEYILTNQSLWQTLHEMTLRHPGYVYGARPYGEGLEYRVFFGLPTRNYWSKPYSNNLIHKLNRVYEILNKNGKGKKDELRKIFNLPDIEDADYENLLIKKAYDYWVTKTKGRYTSFRKYHYMNSERDIIANNIIVSGHNVINAVAVHYKYRENADDDWEDNSTAADKVGEDNVYTNKMVGSSSIDESNIREKEVRFENIKGIGNAVRYGTGELIYGAKNMYEGSLLVLGNTKINPWDIIILNDNVTNMHGPVEVKAVTHTFSYETGFITDVEVNACVTASEKENYPSLISSLVFEARKDLYEKYANRSEITNDDGGLNEDKLEESINKALDEAIRLSRVERSGEPIIGEGIISSFRDILQSTGTVQGINNEELKAGIKEYLEARSLEQLKEELNQRGSVNFLQDLIGQYTAAPAEAGELIRSASRTLGTAAGVFGGTGLVAAAYNRGFYGLSNIRSAIPVGVSIAALAAVGGYSYSDLLTGNIASSFRSGSLGKNFFRKQILARMTMGGVIQIYPLIRDGLPLLAGGYEEVNPTERWNNVLGNIFNDVSDATEGYYKRSKEFNSYGKDIVRQLENGDYGFSAEIPLKLGTLGEFLGLTSKETVVGYFYSRGDE